MKTIVELPGGMRATFERGGVECADPATLETVTLMLWDVENSPSIPDFDHYKAMVVCKRLNGRVVEYAGPPATVPGRIY